MWLSFEQLLLINITMEMWSFQSRKWKYVIKKCVLKCLVKLDSQAMRVWLEIYGILIWGHVMDSKSWFIIKLSYLIVVVQQWYLSRHKIPSQIYGPCRVYKCYSTCSIFQKVCYNSSSNWRNENPIVNFNLELKFKASSFRTRLWKPWHHIIQHVLWTFTHNHVENWYSQESYLYSH